MWLNEKETNLSGIISAAAVVERERDEVFGHSLPLLLWLNRKRRSFRAYPPLPLVLNEKELKLSGIALSLIHI